MNENQAIDRPQDNPTVSVPAGTDFYVYVLVKANVDPVNLISAKLTVPTDLVSETIDIQRLDSSGGVISSWVENVYDFEKKQISLVGGIPNPGFQNNVGQSGKMARLKFRTLDGLTDGKTSRIDFLEADTNMYKNSDNQPIQPLIKRSLTVKIGPIENTVPVESITYTLQSGWNFIGIPVYPDITPKQLLDATSGKCDSVQGFDSNRSQATAYFSDPAKAVLNSLEKIDGGRAYQIKCSQSGVTFTLSGSTVTSMPTLLANTNNYISLPKGKTMKSSEFLNQSSNSHIDCDKVYRWVDDGWELHNKTRPIRDFDMTDQEGYNVMCNIPGSASPSWESVSYTLQAGWNFIGVPVNPNKSAADLLRGLGSDNCTEVQLGTNENIVWHYPDTNNIIEGGGGYLVRCQRSGASIELRGVAVSSMPTLKEGWNYISLPKSKTTKAEDFLKEVTNEHLDCKEVARWIDDGWEDHRKGRFTNNFDMNDKEGYTVKCENSGSTVCAQVITPGLKPSTKECKDFPNACLPEGWTKLKGEGCARVGDLAGDGKFDLGRNFSILFSKFNNPDGSKPQGYEKADINGDGVINTVDFSLMRVIYIGKGKIKELLR
ncbi:MAG: hypothetical protein UT01_C0020G0005 [Candidatus Daviesbacteria bacterium GW2011_GWA1_38_7]|nr:MAG: hypothetical protein UT01_C0020G0005 [Candidatus Daviesbacteria bacterium GW2011_GWA1_38_7]